MWCGNIKESMVSGDFKKACEEYEKITHLTKGRLYFGDIYARSFYMLGKLYEKKSWEAKAIEHYEKFLDLWKDADPGITLRHHRRMQERKGWIEESVIN